MVIIVIKNQSAVLADSQVRALIPALQIQLDRDLCPSWDVGPFHLQFRARGDLIKKGERQFIFLDHTSDASALGYHDVTINGDAISYVGAKETMDDGGEWTVTASHELLEMCVNDHLDDSELDEAANRLYIKEVCDAVESDSLGYKIMGHLLSDFVLPGWFQPEVKHTAKLSFCGHVSKPYELAPGGYISFIDLARPSKGWQQIFAKEDDPVKRPGTARGVMRDRVAIRHTKRKSVSI
jgi:hypothetical protein